MFKRMAAGIVTVGVFVGVLAGFSGCAAASESLGALSRAANAGQSSVAVSGGSVSYYFPRGGQEAQPQLISVIRSAKETLDMAIYSFTDTSIAAAVVADKKGGVTVRVITDKECSSNKYQKTVLSTLKKAGIPVKVNTHSGLMHLKVSIVDSSVATTGSFNYTKGAETENDEVLVVLRSKQAAGDFETQFNRMWNDKSGFKNWSNS